MFDAQYKTLAMAATPTSTWQLRAGEDGSFVRLDPPTAPPRPSETPLPMSRPVLAAPTLPPPPPRESVLDVPVLDLIERGAAWMRDAAVRAGAAVPASATAWAGERLAGLSPTTMLVAAAVGVALLPTVVSWVMTAVAVLIVGVAVTRARGGA